MRLKKELSTTAGATAATTTPTTATTATTSHQPTGSVVAP